MKLKDIWGKLTRPIKNWHAFRPDNLDKLADQYEAALKRAKMTVARQQGYIYINNGLNRKERRTLEAQLRKGVVREGGRRPLTKEQRAFSQWQLRESAINVPAQRSWLMDNIKRVREGMPILIYSLKGRRA